MDETESVALPGTVKGILAMSSSSTSPTVESDPRAALDAASIEPAPVASADRAASFFYKHLPVNAEGGIRLLDFNGADLKARRIRAWVDDVHWRYAVSGPAVTSPLGNGTGADANWAYPGFVQFHVILLQPGGITFHFNGTAGGEQEFGLDNAKSIVVNVNDAKGTYGDNSGAYSLNVEILEA